MEKMKITFLGTGNAVPTKLRNHTAILVNFKDENILVDCGEGTQRQFRYADMSPTKITKMLLTHWHGDHTLGIPGLFETLAMSEYQKILEVYGPRGTNRHLGIMAELFKEFKIKYESKELSNTKIENEDYIIESREMNHGTPTLAYSIILKDRIRIDKAKLKKFKIPNSPLIGDLQRGKDITFNGKKISAKSVTYTEKGKKITIIMDTGVTPATVEIAKDSDILIVESTFSQEDEKQAREYLHLTAKDAAEIAKKAKAKKLILTHISQRYEHALHIIEKEAKKVFKNTVIAKDLDNFEI